MPEPMPISWLSPIKPQPPSAMMRHATGAALGLTLGLVLAVPLVLWQKGRIDPVSSIAQMAANFGLAEAAPKAAVMTEVREPIAREPASREPAVEVVRAVPRSVAMPVEMTRPATTSVIVSVPPPADTTSVASLKPAVEMPLVQAEPTRAQTEAAKAAALLEDARRLIGEGDFRTARSVLEDQTVSAMPTARFLLAETYDPNYLAARGVRTVRAEVPRAIELYRLALDGGIEAARQRISALRP
jgi:hypothetical protein